MTPTALETDTLGAALAWGAERLRAAGVAEARRDSRLLLSHALGGRPDLVTGYPERPLAPDQAAAFRAAVGRRAAREPVARILGRREFWGLEFRVSPATLDPRPDSETLIEALLDRLPDPSAPLSLLDLGTGTGCLLLALLSELPAATGVGIDRSEEALAVARANAEALGLAARATFRQGDWAEGLDGGWQVIVSNPPYIVSAEIPDLPPEVARFDPRAALDGGVDGLAAYRRIASRLPDLLDRSGILALEIGAGQGDEVEAILAAAGLAPLGRRRDLAGIERCVLAARPDGKKLLESGVIPSTL